LEFDSVAAFPATGTTGQVYLAKDTGDTYRWDASAKALAYVRISERVLSTGVTDSSVVGREVLTAVDEAAGRAALVVDDAVSVLTYGAVGDGSVDDTAAFTAALAAGGSVRVPAGVYRLDSSVVLTEGQSVKLDAGAVLKAGVSLTGALLDAADADGVQIVGDGAVIDLNAITDRAIRIQGSVGALVTGCAISGVRVINRATTPSSSVSAIDVRYADHPTVTGVQVKDFGGDNPKGSTNVYGIQIAACYGATLSKISIDNCGVGIRIGGSTDTSVSQFSIANCLDNGVYILVDDGAGPTSLSQGTIDNCEEGIVIRTDDVTVSQCRVINCANKGITLRRGQRSKIQGCSFEANTVHLGNGSTVEDGVFRLSVSYCTFKNAIGRPIGFFQLEDSEFNHIDMLESVSNDMAGLLRVSDAVRCSIRNSRFTNPGKANTVFVMLSGACFNNSVVGNVFAEAQTAVRLLTSGASPVNTSILDNVFLDVTTPVLASAGVTGTIRRDPNVIETSSAASSVNWARIDSSATGQPVVFRARGGDAAVNLNLVPVGAGVLQANGVQVEVKGHTHTVAQVTGARSWAAVPASSTATGTAGQEAYDANFHYICVGTNTWKRIAYDLWV
jgi:hypothetical protein